MCDLNFQSNKLLTLHIDKFHMKNGKLIDKSKYSRHSSRCEVCQNYFPSDQISEHTKSCHIYSKHIKQTLKGYQCLICSHQIDSYVRNTIFEHIDGKHPEYAPKKRYG